MWAFTPRSVDVLEGEQVTCCTGSCLAHTGVTAQGSIYRHAVPSLEAFLCLFQIKWTIIIINPVRISTSLNIFLHNSISLKIIRHPLIPSMLRSSHTPSRFNFGHCLPFIVRDHVSQPFSTTDNIIVLYILIFKFLERSLEDKSVWTE